MESSAQQPRTAKTNQNTNLQKWTLVTHASVVVLIVAATTVLAFKGVLTADAIVGLFGTALGFSGAAAAYRTGIRHSDSNGGS